MEDRQERIRIRAYELWLLDGQPEGRDAEHWFRAAEAIRLEDIENSAGTVNPSFEVIGGYLTPRPKRATTASSKPPAPQEARKPPKQPTAEDAELHAARAPAAKGAHPKLASLHRSGQPGRIGKVQGRHH